MPDAPTDVPHAPTAGPYRGRIEALALALTLSAGLATWGVGIVTCGYDYDEVQRAHSVWLAAQGRRPYRDFFECHPPYFPLLTPVFSLSAGPCEALRALRLIAAAGNLLFLAGLVALASPTAGPGRRWAALGVAAVALHPKVLGFLVEFRIDGWGYALGAWGLYRFGRLPRGAYRGFEAGVMTGVGTLLFCPKMALLPPLVVAADLLVAWRTPRVALRSVAGYAAGVGAAAALFLLYLAWHRIDLGSVSQLLGRYHVESNAHGGFRRGLLGKVVEDRWLLGLIVAGAAAGTIRHVRRGTWPSPYEAGLAAWLVAQAVLVNYPYKQYYAPWFLFASWSVASLGLALEDLTGRAATAAFLAACVAIGASEYHAVKGWDGGREARAQEALIRWMNRVAHPGDTVVGSPPLHPIDRDDAFFLWFNTSDPSGFDSEQILARLPSYRRYVAPGRYLEELEAHPPALVAVSGGGRVAVYTSGQYRALSAFLKAHGYRSVRVGSSAVFTVRPDRLEQARRDGLAD